MITKEALAEIKLRLPPSEIIGAVIELKPYLQGGTMRGRSPFVAPTCESEPAFYVHDHKSTWVDFEAARSGDIFDFVMAHYGLTWEEAVRCLAEKAGIKLDDWLIENDPNISPREAALAFGAAIYPKEYVEPEIERFAMVEWTHAVPKAVARAVLSYLADREVDIAREMAILAKRIAKPAPRFLTSLNCDAFRSVLGIQAQMGRMEKLRRQG